MRVSSEIDDFIQIIREPKIFSGFKNENKRLNICSVRDLTEKECKDGNHSDNGVIISVIPVNVCLAGTHHEGVLVCVLSRNAGGKKEEADDLFT